MTQTPRIVAAALCRPNGRAVALDPPARHHDVIQHMRHLGHSVEEIAHCEQGFLTDQGGFVDRKAAWPIAEAAGQLNRLPGGAEGLLFSENVW